MMGVSEAMLFLEEVERSIGEWFPIPEREEFQRTCPESGLRDQNLPFEAA